MAPAVVGFEEVPSTPPLPSLTIPVGSHITSACGCCLVISVYIRSAYCGYSDGKCRKCHLVSVSCSNAIGGIMPSHNTGYWGITGQIAGKSTNAAAIGSMAVSMLWDWRKCSSRRPSQLQRISVGGHITAAGGCRLGDIGNNSCNYSWQGCSKGG